MRTRLATPALDDFLDQPELVVGNPSMVIPDRHGRGHINFPDLVGAELLKRGVSIERLVVGISVEKGGGLVGQCDRQML